MAADKRFSLPQKARKTPIGGASYALHVDASLVAKYLRNYSEERGVTRTEGLVTEVEQKEDGGIAKLILKSGKEVEGDFFIDCTGFYSLLIEKTLGVGFEDWLNYLPCDRAVAVQTENTEEAIPYTIVGTVEFFQRREIKDILAYLRVRENPADRTSLERIINVPRRGIGARALAAVRSLARERGLRLVFANAELARSANDITLSGKLEGVTVEEALDVVLPTCRMSHRIADGLLMIDAEANEN